MIRIFTAFLLMVAATLNAATTVPERFTIPASEFDLHAYPKEVSGYTLDDEQESIRQLGERERLHIRYWIETNLINYVASIQDSGKTFEVCATVANLNAGINSTIRIHHPNRTHNQLHVLEGTQYKNVCSKQGKFDDLQRSAGLLVLQGSVEVRAFYFRLVSDLAPLTTETSPSWDLDLRRVRVPVYDDDGAIVYRNDGTIKYSFDPNEQAWAVLTIGDVVYVGGEFENIKNSVDSARVQRKYIAAFDRSTGEPIVDFDLELDGRVFALAASPDNDTLYIGGAFNTADGQDRRKFAAYDIANGTLSGFRLKSDKGTNINPNGALRDIAVTDDRIYLAGLFSRFGGNPDHGYVAAFDRNTGKIVSGFKPRPNKTVKALIADGAEGLWIGGDFKKVGGIEHEGLALVNYYTGRLVATSPAVPYPVIDLAATSTQLFVAGGGRNADGRFTGNVAAAFERSNSNKKQWELEGDGNVQAVDVVDTGEYVYFGGHYKTFRYIRNDRTLNDNNPKDYRWIKNGSDVERLSRHNKSTGEIDFNWLPYVNGIRSINGIDVTVDGLHIVGDFTRVGGDTRVQSASRKEHRGFAIFKGATN